MVFLIVGCAVGALLALLLVNLQPDERHISRPLPHIVASSDPAFAGSMAGLIGASVEPGHAIQTLVNGAKIFPAMLAAIEHARSTINFETYIYWSGRAGTRFAEALADKARKGVAVNVLIDAVGGAPMDEKLIEKMKSAGVNVRIFRPVHWYTFDRMNNRTHRKVLVIDGAVGFTGGVGIADEWDGDARTPDEWRDNHYRIEGPAVAVLQSAFTENWLEATGDVLIGNAYFPELKPAGDLAVQTVKSSPLSGSETVHLMLLTALASAESHIRIAMAYFVPNEIAMQQLLQARQRGVEIEVIVPGEHADHAGVRAASRYFWGELLAAGVRIYEFSPSMYHVKLVVVDDVWASVGSANFDERSFRLNDEANLSVFDAGFARSQIDLFNLDKSRSREITLEEWQSRPIKEKALDFLWSNVASQM